MAVWAIAVCLLVGCSNDPDSDAENPAEPGGTGAEAPADAGQQTEVRVDTAIARPMPLRSELGEFFQLIQTFQTGAARVRIKKILNLNPTDGQANFLFAMSYHRERRYTLALPYFERAIEHAPQFDNAWHFYGWALYYEGQPVRAREVFEQHLAFMPDSDDSHFGLGLIDLDEGALDDAEQRFSHALELITDDPKRGKDRGKSLLGRADVELARGNVEAALQHLLDSVFAYDQSFESWGRLARVYEQLGEPEKAADARTRSEVIRERLAPTPDTDGSS